MFLSKFSRNIPVHLDLEHQINHNILAAYFLRYIKPVSTKKHITLVSTTCYTWMYNLDVYNLDV